MPLISAWQYFNINETGEALIIIPTYNERENIVLLIPEIRKVFQRPIFWLWMIIRLMEPDSV